MNNFKKWDLVVGWTVFALSLLVYLLTMEPSASLWDCAEFIATSYKLEVGHPPGAPLMMMIARFFTLFAPGAQYAAVMVNTMSCTASALTILFLFWSITHLARRIYSVRNGGREMNAGQMWSVLGAGFVGAMAYTFTDTFWFSAIEGEVYALSSMFTALVVWAMLKWEEQADEPHANRWLILIAYLMGLSIGVHILNLLTIPALVFVYYFRKYDRITAWGAVKATGVALLILGFINALIIPYTVAIGAAFDKFFVNTLGAPINSGMVFFVFALFALCGWGVWYTHRKGKVLLNTIVLCITVILIGYGSYASVTIRAAANPPMNSNDPSNPYALLSLLNRDQYGDRPLLFGPYYSSPASDIKMKTSTYVTDEGKYAETEVYAGTEHPSEFTFFFPRMYNPNKAEEYEAWADVEGRKMRYGDEVITVPTFGENLRYFFSYQLNFMYWRYFLWNFVGRQSDRQSTGEINDGQWLSGIKAIDRLYLGPQDGLPDEMASNKGRNKYYFLPFILGIIGLVYQLNRDPKNFTVVMWLFIMMGIALVFYFNTCPSEPRERDYVYAGSFYAFCMWIGFGVMWLRDLMVRYWKNSGMAPALAATAVCCCVPAILCAENWDDHDRSGRYWARDMGYNYLASTLPNSIVMNFGDNDTFPLWYNQEVESVRPDVRVMNMSYLGGDWYIDEMKRRYNESDPVPFSLPRSKYINRTNEVLPVKVLINDPVPVSQIIDFVKNDDPRTQLPWSGGDPLDYIPTKKIAIPVNKENAIASGIVKPEDADLMVDTLYLTLTKGSIDKSELMLLDLLSNFDWKRPLYFTQLSLLNTFGGIKEYLQFDGAGYRLVPIRTPLPEGLRANTEVGRIDPDYLYDKLMNQFRYGNLSNPKVYSDSFVQNNVNTMQTRTAFARLAVALAARGEREEALKVLERGIAEVPFEQVTPTYTNTVPVIEAFYKIGAPERGDEILLDYARSLNQYVVYYSSFPDGKYELIQSDLQQKALVMYELYEMAKRYGRTEAVAAITDYFKAME